MRRRTVLALAGTLTLAGCLSDAEANGARGGSTEATAASGDVPSTGTESGDDAGDAGDGTETDAANDFDEPEDAPDDDADAEAETSSEQRVEVPPDYQEPGIEERPEGGDGPFESRVLGDRDGVENPDENLPHRLRVWNEGEEREVAVRVVGNEGGELLAETFSFPAGTRRSLELELLRPDVYAVEFSRPDEESAATVYVPRAFFDCNASVTDVVANPDWSFEWSTTSNAAGCSGS